MELIGSLADLALEEGWSAQDQSAMEAELQRGWNAKEALKKEADAQATAQAREFRDFHQKVGAWGKPVLSLPAQDYWEILNEQGKEFFDERTNVQWVQNKFPEYRASKA